MASSEYNDLANILDQDRRNAFKSMSFWLVTGHYASLSAPSILKVPWIGNGKIGCKDSLNQDLGV